MLYPEIRNFIGGEWVNSQSTQHTPVTNSATGEVLGQCPLSTTEETNAAIEAAHTAFQSWKNVPPVQRARYIFKFKQLLEDNKEEIARLCTMEHGKTLAEARGDIGRGIENVEHACGIPSLMMGKSLSNVANGIDCASYREPMGVFAAITPFNFPPMVPLWFLPYAIATGNTVVLKPSEQVPLSQQLIFKLLQETGLPAGVVNMVNGGKDVVNALCEHKNVKGVSFVGSTPVAQIVYDKASQNGKRVQSLGGAKNFLIVMPDAKMGPAMENVAESIFGCAGQRCLAGAIVVGVGEAYNKVKEGLLENARNIKMGYGLDDESTMGPVISRDQQHRILSMIDKAKEQGATPLLDRSRETVPGYENGYWVGPTVFENINPEMEIAQKEVFGPVACLTKADTLEDAIAMLNKIPFANAGSIYTSNGESVRKFRRGVDPAMLGINIGVAAPMAFFPFGGSKDSFFGSTKVHGEDAIHFYTEQKVEISRWFEDQ